MSFYVINSVRKAWFASTHQLWRKRKLRTDEQWRYPPTLFRRDFSSSLPNSMHCLSACLWFPLVQTTRYKAVFVSMSLCKQTPRRSYLTRYRTSFSPPSSPYMKMGTKRLLLWCWPRLASGVTTWTKIKRSLQYSIFVSTCACIRGYGYPNGSQEEPHLSVHLWVYFWNWCTIPARPNPKQFASKLHALMLPM